MISPVRQRIIAQAEWGVNHAAAIHYAETRPIPLHRWRAGQLPITTDCSGYVTCCYFAAGAPDPNGQHFDGEGFTGTLLDHCEHIPAAAAEGGDLVVFGPPPGNHVVLLLADRIRCASHGREADPVIMPLAEMAAGFPGQPITYLRAVPASPAPTPPPAWRWEVWQGGHVVHDSTSLALAVAFATARLKAGQHHAGTQVCIRRAEGKVPA